MKTQLSPEQISSYQENGFLIIENFLDSAELENWRRITDEAVANRLNASANAGDWGKDSNSLSNQGNDDSYYSQVFTQCIRLADTHEGMHELMYDARLGEVAGTLAGVDGIRIWHDQALIKPPFGNATAWHLDNPYWSFSSPNSISIWVPLDDATLHNGCMYYLPGTHKTARYDNVNIGQNQRDLFKVYPEWIGIEAVSGPCPAGSAVFHNGLTAHGAGTNMTPRPRRAMTCAYMPDGSTFNGVRNILPEDYFNSLKIGDVLNNEEQNPLIWSRN
ncbi:MAG TPA: phytanoyl-CoA dioxygenase family protein [Abditibacteriaceae bacterium]|jgi:ectoine hydroxylase-related dioxygenase (phytanoyl-CoA dioxygenase family)